MPSFTLHDLDLRFCRRIGAKTVTESVRVKALIPERLQAARRAHESVCPNPQSLRYRETKNALKPLAQCLAIVGLVLTLVGCAYHAPDAPTPIAPLASTAPATLNLGSVAGTGSSVGATTLTATVQNSGGVALPGVLVSFATDVGTLSETSMTTTASGQAVTTLTSAAGSTAAVSVTAGTLSTRLLVTTPPAVVAPPLPQPPVPLPDPTPPTPPLTVQLLAAPRQAGTATDFSLATTSIRTATWTFGDASAPVTTSDPFVSHTYAVGGTYTASVTVTDTLGRQASATTTVTIQAAPLPPGPPPTGVGVAMTCTTAVHGSATVCNVAVANNGVPLASNTITKVDWDWGDGVGQIINNSPLGSHIFAQAGSYRIEANITVLVNGELRQVRATVTVPIL